MEEWITALTPLLAAFAGWAAARLKSGAKREKAVEQGVKSLLRGQIIDLGLHYLEKQSIPPYGLDNLINYYTAYRDLGDGDGSVAGLVDKCRALPIRPGGAQAAQSAAVEAAMASRGSPTGGAQAAQSAAAAEQTRDEKEGTAWHKALKTARSPATR